MKKRGLLACAILLLAAHRLPAPIQEVTENPTPTAKSETDVAPSSKPKKSRAKSSSAPEKSVAKPNVGSKTGRFAGKWVGIMHEVPWGGVATELIIDSTGSTMDWQESGREKGRSSTSVAGNTIQGNFHAGVAVVWSLTPLSDGATARVRIQCFMNDFTAVFRRTGLDAGSSKPGR